jgi:hypothetical protein
MLRVNNTRCSLTLVLGLSCALASAGKRDKVDKPQATALQPQTSRASSPTPPILGDVKITAAVDTSQPPDDCRVMPAARLLRMLAHWSIGSVSPAPELMRVLSLGL